MRFGLRGPFVWDTSQKCIDREGLVKPPPNGRNIGGPRLPTLLDVKCYVCLHTLLHVVACCWELLRKVWNQSNFPTFLLFRDRRSEAQQCWIRLHNSSYIAGATHVHNTWSPWRQQVLRVVFFPLCSAIPSLLEVVASVCTALPTRSQQFTTLLAQHCCELLRPFARSSRRRTGTAHL